MQRTFRNLCLIWGAFKNPGRLLFTTGRSGSIHGRWEHQVEHGIRRCWAIGNDRFLFGIMLFNERGETRVSVPAPAPGGTE